MKLSNLHPARGYRRLKKRVGRGPGSGMGKTAGRGSKGQLSGSGFSRTRGYEGGQMPLHRRLPKRGFTNIFRSKYSLVNLDSLDKIAKAEVGIPELVEAGLIGKNVQAVKILGRGQLTSAKSVTAHKFSRSAQKKIEEAGGKAILAGRS